MNGQQTLKYSILNIILSFVISIMFIKTYSNLTNMSSYIAWRIEIRSIVTFNHIKLNELNLLHRVLHSNFALGTTKVKKLFKLNSIQ